MQVVEIQGILRSAVTNSVALLLFGVVGILPCRAQEQAPSTLPATAQAAPQQQGSSDLDDGLRYLKTNQPGKALAAFQRILQTDPDNATANLLAASAAWNLFQGDAAVTYAEKARDLAPNDWRVDTTLVATYAAAGKVKERDAERAKLVALHDNAAAPDAMKANGFLLDLFRVKEYRVEVVQYFKPIGKFHTYYRFLVRNTANKRLWEYDLQSDDFSQKSWADAHPQEAASGGRQFSLESDTGDTHTEYRLFSGNPAYDNVRAVVVNLLQERTSPFPAETPKPAPAVQ
jgi:tetratricopeptide (TPR) repeat protein